MRVGRTPVVWHQRRDTLLRIHAGNVHIPIGIWPGDLDRHNITVEYTLDEPYAFESAGEFRQRRDQDRLSHHLRIGLDEDNPLGTITRITPDFLAALRYQNRENPTASRPYATIDQLIADYPSGAPAYYEAVLHSIPLGARLRYRVKLYVQNRRAVVIPGDKQWYTVYAVEPEFDVDDIKFVYDRPSAASGYNVIYWKNVDTRQLISLRFDAVDVERLMDDFRLDVQHVDGTLTNNSLGWVRVEPQRWPQVDKDPNLCDPIGTTFTPPDTSMAKDWSLPVVPVINGQFDFATITLPLNDLSDVTRLTWRGTDVATITPGGLQPTNNFVPRPVRLMFVHYANQSLNDLFEAPNKNYSPPRTYIQTTMRDNLGTYSSRPDSNEDGIGDGYSFVLRAHVRNRLPCVWAMDGAFVSMLAQDSRKSLRSMRRAMKKGLFEPAVGGFGGHKMLYFQQSTNTQAVQYGIDVIERILGGTSALFYPNSRLYAATPNIDTAILDGVVHRPLILRHTKRKRRLRADKAASKLRFVLADQTAFDLYASNAHTDRIEADVWTDHRYAYLWRQRCLDHRDKDDCTDDCASWAWLFASATLKDRLLSACPRQWQAGKLIWNLRAHFIYGAAHPEKTRGAIFVYSDDLDKAAGNGWFDGDYNGQQNHNAAVFAAALEWVAAHPWIQVVSVADLDPNAETIGCITVKDAIDPSIFTEPTPPLTPWSSNYLANGTFESWARWQVSRGGSELGFEYGRWYLKWREMRSKWLDRSFGTIADSLEGVLFDPTSNTDNALDEIARLEFLAAIHEACWSKKPLEPYVTCDDLNHGLCDAKYAYQRIDIQEPEDFIQCATLQVRNAFVFHCAARWAELAGSGAIGQATWTDSGPLVERIAEIRERWCTDLQQPNVPPELQWDLDVTPNTIVYNDRVLMVMDANGGRISHVFGMHDGQPVVYSGQIKAYQYLGDERGYAGRLPSDGGVFQNTVLTPNHRYIASDLTLSRATIGNKRNTKPLVVNADCGSGSVRTSRDDIGDEEWLYPDNFGIYERRLGDGVVTWAYPGFVRDVAPKSSDEFDRHVAEYRAFVLDPHRVPRDPLFSKTIRVVGRRIEIRYDGVLSAGHLVGNELSLDFHSMLLRGKRQGRRWHVTRRAHTSDGSFVTAIELRSGKRGPRATLAVIDNCRFSFETLEGKANRRLHRAFSDCLEVQSEADGAFSYAISLD